MALLPLDERERRRHKRRNLIQSLALLAAMAALLALLGWLVAGLEGVLWTLVMGGAMLAFAPSVSPRWLLRLYGARPLATFEVPELHRVLARLAERAGLARAPELHYVPSPIVNAFAVGRPHQAAIAVTDGLLRRLPLREIAGVLAHEVSHIRNDDLWLMTLADVISRLTGAMVLVGMMLLVVNLPLVLLGQETVSWWLILVLIVAPHLGALLQLALSRTREFDADLDAAGLTGDPLGLASALARLEQQQARLWESLMLPGRRLPEPSLLRTHPPTEERVRRLLALAGAALVADEPRPQLVLLPDHLRPRHATPRWRMSGLWY